MTGAPPGRERPRVPAQPAPAQPPAARASREPPAPAAGAPPAEPSPHRRRGPGIYGTIITAAVLAVAGPSESGTDLAVSVLVTLLVYWVAEQYSDLLGDLHGGHLPSWRSVGSALRGSWGMVSASFFPLGALLFAELLGASTTIAANVGLAMAVLLLMVYAWQAGHAARLTGWRLTIVTSLAAVLGLLMVVLKDVVILSMH
jgi:hypothetical protein